MAKKIADTKKKKKQPYLLRKKLKKKSKKSNASRQSYTPDLIQRALEDIQKMVYPNEKLLKNTIHPCM